MKILKLTRNTTLFAAACLALVTVSCSDDDGNAMVDDMGTQPDGAAAMSIVEVASSNADFSTLVDAVKRAGLASTLGGAGSFTVFAPNNQAFKDSGITDVNAVPVDQLKQILLYHVISGAAVVSSAVKAGPVDSAADLTFFIGTSGGVTLNGGNSVTGGANIISTDITANNGVIHVIDRVILPPDIPTAATYGGLTELVKAVGAAADISAGTSVLKELQGAGPFTVFAPTDDAFKAITAPGDAAALRDVLLYHVVGSKVMSSGIPAKADSLLKNSWGNGVTMLFDTSSGVMVNGASVKIADIKTTNGVVHVIDKVLLPPDIIDIAGIAGLSSLAGAIGAAAALPGGTSVLDALKASEPYTVFAPTDAAFKGITVPSDTAVLRDVLLLHVVKAAQPVLSSGLPASAVDSLLSGKKLSFNASAPSVSSDGTSSAMIGPFDINVTNGVVHVIDKVLLP